MQYRVLGPLSLISSDGELRIGSARQRTVLAMLLLSRCRVVPVDRLIDALWPVDPPATARVQVQICVSALRRTLTEAEGTDPIRTVSPGYVLQVPDDAVDLAVFSRLVADARSEAERNPAAAVERLHAALRLWRGEAFSGVSSPLVQAAATQLAEQRLAATEFCLDLELALGRHEEVCQRLAGLVREYPLRERLRWQQMLALYRSGRQAEALAAYRDARQVLVAELGLEPGPELRELERAILTADPALDLAPRETGPDTPVVPRQLPADIPDFAGRAELIARIRQLAHVDDRESPGTAVPAIVITGRAGVGKTALAIRVAHELANHFPAGQLYAQLRGEDARPLAAVRVLERFLRALGVAGNAIPETVAERGEMFRSLIAGRRLLIVLDDAASESQVIPLLPGTAGPRVLVTSRRRLAGLAGARQVEVEVLDRATAVRLLAAQSGRTLTGTELASAEVLAEQCAGLPLAIRIAAARLASRPHWSIGDLTARMLDGQRRLDELRYGEMGVRFSIALTYDALPDPARRLFRMLGLIDAPDFPSWITAPLLELAVPDAVELLEMLVDARMVDVTASGHGVRYRLHDLLRIYARERLAAEEPAAERTAALRRLLGCLLYLAEQGHQREYGGDYTVLHSAAPRWPLDASITADLLAEPYRWLERERGTLVEAVGQAARAGLHEQAWDLAISTVVLFERGMYFDDWRETHELALAAARQHGDRVGEAAMRYSLGALSVAELRLADAVSHLTAAQRIFDDCGIGHGIALSLRNLAFVDRLQGRTSEALSKYERSLDLLRVAGDRVAEAHVLNGLGRIHIERGEYDTARCLLEQALAICRTTGNHRVAAQTLHSLGEACVAQGDLAGAQSRFEAVLRTVRMSGDRIGEAYALHGLAVVAVGQHRLADAEQVLATRLKLARSVGERMVEGRLLLTLGETQLARGRPTVAVGLLTDALRLFRQLRAPLWQARTLHLLGALHEASGDPEAARLAWRDGLALLDGVETVAGSQLAELLTDGIGRTASG